MANSFGADILIQAEDPKNAASFYVQQLAFKITDETPRMISLDGQHINLVIERGPALGPVFEVTVESRRGQNPPGEEWRRGCER